MIWRRRVNVTSWVARHGAEHRIEGWPVPELLSARDYAVLLASPSTLTELEN